MARVKIQKNISYDDVRKLYYVNLDYGKNEDGKRVKKTETFKSKKEAKERLKRFEADKTNDEVVMPREETLGEWLDYWMDTVRTGIKVRCRNAIFQHPIHKYMIANLDGIANDPKEGSCIFALVGGNSFIWHEVKRDEELIGHLIQMEGEFWECVTEGKPPKMDGSEPSTEWLKNEFEGGTEGGVFIPEDGMKWVEQYLNTEELIKGIAEKKDEAANNLKLLLGNHEEGYAGSHIIKWSSVRSNRFDTKRFQTDYPELYKDYVKEGVARRFSLQ